MPAAAERPYPLGAYRGWNSVNVESTGYEVCLVRKLLILRSRLPVSDRVLAHSEPAQGMARARTH